MENKEYHKKIIESFKKHIQETSSGGMHFNPDNHDQINMAISILQIESNEKLSQSNEKHAKAMNWLTGGILFLGVIDILMAIL